MKFASTALIILIILSACHISPENTYYTLTALPSRTTYHKNIVLDKVNIPDILDRPQIILKSSSNEIHVLEYERWAEPLNDMIYRVLNDDMNTLQTNSHKQAANNRENEQRVTVTIDEFYAYEDGDVELKASWKVNSQSTSHSFTRNISSKSHDMDSYITVMSILLNEFAKSIVSRSN